MSVSALSWCCGCLSRKFCCGPNRNRNELLVFDTQPLISEEKEKKKKTDVLHNSQFLKLQPTDIANLLSKFLWHEITKKTCLIQQTHYLGNDSFDTFYCVVCHSRNHITFVQFEISNRYFGNVWNGNQYVIQFICSPCSKTLEKQLIRSVKNIEEKIWYLYIMLLTRKLLLSKCDVLSREKLIHQILCFLPTSFLTIRAITYHNNYKNKKMNKTNFQNFEDDLSIWMSEHLVY